MGWRNLLCLFILKGKSPNYYHKTHRELGYVMHYMPLEAELKQPINPKGNKDTMDWDSNISTGAIFQDLTANVTSTSNNVGDNDLPPLLEDLWV